MKLIYDVYPPYGGRFSRIARSPQDAITDLHGRTAGYAARMLHPDTLTSEQTRNEWRARMEELGEPLSAWLAERQPVRHWPRTLWRRLRGI